MTKVLEDLEVVAQEVPIEVQSEKQNQDQTGNRRKVDNRMVVTTLQAWTGTLALRAQHLLAVHQLATHQSVAHR